MKEILALIPARGGSKGVARKNLRRVGGRSLVARSIDHARGSRRITRIVVSTDDAAIAAASREAGADVPFLRPSILAEDATPDLPVFQHALGWLRDEEGYAPELVVHLRPTSPFRDPAVIDQAVELLLDHPEADALKSVALADQTPYKMWSQHEGLLVPVLGLPGEREPYNLPRQALPRVYWQNGYVDVLRPRVLHSGLMHGDRILAFVVDRGHVDIDDEEALRRARRLAKRPDLLRSTAPQFSS